MVEVKLRENPGTQSRRYAETPRYSENGNRSTCNCQAEDGGRGVLSIRMCRTSPSEFFALSHGSRRRFHSFTFSLALPPPCHPLTTVFNMALRLPRSQLARLARAGTFASRQQARYSSAAVASSSLPSSLKDSIAVSLLKGQNTTSFHAGY